MQMAQYHQLAFTTSRLRACFRSLASGHRLERQQLLWGLRSSIRMTRLSLSLACSEYCIKLIRWRSCRWFLKSKYRLLWLVQRTELDSQALRRLYKSEPRELQWCWSKLKLPAIIFSRWSKALSLKNLCNLVAQPILRGQFKSRSGRSWLSSLGLWYRVQDHWNFLVENSTWSQLHRWSRQDSQEE